MRKLTDAERAIAKIKKDAIVKQWKLDHPDRTRELARDGYHRNKHKRMPRKQARDPVKVRKNSRDAYWRHRDERVLQSKEYYATHKEQQLASQKAFNAAHPEIKAARGKAYYAANKEKWDLRTPWRLKFPERHAAKEGRRRAYKLGATPSWANQFFIDEAYDLARRRTKATGFEWHVDHIVPLKSKIVCGLHNEFNLQVIPAARNISKSNRHWPNMPRPLLGV